jgi:hypothetical protein
MVLVENTLQNNQEPNLDLEKSDKTSKIFFIVSLMFFIIIFGLYIYFFLQKNQTQNEIKFVDIPRPETEFYEIDPETESFVKTEEEPVGTVITDLELDEDPGGFKPVGMILKGYVDLLNLDNQNLKFKNRFLKSTTFQLLDVNTSKIKDFYCWPTYAPNNSDVDIRNVELGLSSPEALIYHPDEDILSLGEWNRFDMKDAYIIIQLEDEYDFDKTNYIRKLVVVDCK